MPLCGRDNRGERRQTGRACHESDPAAVSPVYRRCTEESAKSADIVQYTASTSVWSAGRHYSCSSCSGTDGTEAGWCAPCRSGRAGDLWKDAG